MGAIEPMEEAVARAATESTATELMATVVTMVAEQKLESAPSVTVATVGVETSDLPTRKTMRIEVARRNSNLVVNPATKLKIELVYSTVYSMLEV